MPARFREVAPVPELLYSLALLACPVGMGLMMWMMMRGKGQGSAGSADTLNADEVTRLRAEVDQLRCRQRDADVTRSTDSVEPH